MGSARRGRRVVRDEARQVKSNVRKSGRLVFGRRTVLGSYPKRASIFSTVVEPFEAGAVRSAFKADVSFEAGCFRSSSSLVLSS
jgi:hypothetical protein